MNAKYFINIQFHWAVTKSGTSLEKNQNSKPFFSWFLTGFIKIHVQVKTQYGLLPGFFLDFYIEYKKPQSFPILDIEKPA